MKIKILAVVLVIVLVAFSSSILGQKVDEKIINIKDYELKKSAFVGDCYGLKDALSARYVSPSYIPDVGWVISVDGAGQFNFDKMATAIQNQLWFSLDLEVGAVKKETKIFVSFKLIAGDDYILVFKAEDLNNVENWKVYRGGKESKVQGYKYAASKTSEVFHYINCSYVANIKPENLILFKTRKEAIASGRRPCKKCKP